MPAFNLNDYETVESRLARFWADNPNGRIFTELVSSDLNQFIVKAFVYRDANDLHPIATGYAEERVTMKGVNSTSAMENCETSSLGRALANWIYATKGSRPSREEMEKVARAQQPETPHGKLVGLLMSYSKDKNVRKAFVSNALGREFATIEELSEQEVQELTESLESAINLINGVN